MLITQRPAWGRKIQGPLCLQRRASDANLYKLLRNTHQVDYSSTVTDGRAGFGWQEQVAILSATTVQVGRQEKLQIHACEHSVTLACVTEDD